MRRSNRNRGGGVVIEPVHPLPQADLLPLTRDLVGDPVLVGKASPQLGFTRVAALYIASALALHSEDIAKST